MIPASSYRKTRNAVQRSLAAVSDEVKAIRRADEVARIEAQDRAKAGAR